MQDIDVLENTHVDSTGIVAYVVMSTGSKSNVNRDIFASVFLSGNFAYVKFCENKILSETRNHSVVYLYVGISCPSREFITGKYVFNALHEHKILAKISGSTVWPGNAANMILLKATVTWMYPNDR